MFEGDESTLISAFEVGVPFCSALGFLVGSSVSMMPEILAMIVAESARAGGFGPRAVRRGFLRRVDPMGDCCLVLGVRLLTERGRGRILDRALHRHNRSSTCGRASRCPDASMAAALSLIGG
jgi:hypothetical protein